MQNLLDNLKALLAQNSRFMADDKLLKNTIVEAALKPDSDLLELLLSDATIKEHFFTKVSGTLVFDKVKFHEFVSNKQFLEDSYTAFKNRLGLGDGKSFLKESKDVVLSWPYKDCVLEGGMTKEDKAHDEIFYNTTLAPDDITRLTDKKVFTNFEFWDGAAVKAKKSKKVKSIDQSENLLIKGNNLLALHCLKHRYAGKVKLIYIDPPYNTENDSFRYNDSFNHSTWLTFMKNRLEIARELLSDDGVIFVQCDDNEQAYLKILMDEVFGRDNFIEALFILNNLKGNYNTNYFANVGEYCLVFSRNKNIFRVGDLVSDDREELENWQEDEKGLWKVGRNLKATGADGPREKRPTMFFPLYVSDNDTLSIKKDKTHYIEVFPITNGQDMRWNWSKEFFEKELDEVLVIRGREGKINIHKKQRPTVSDVVSKKPKNLFYHPSYSNTVSASHMKKLFGEKLFQYSKSEFLIADYIAVATQPNDIVLDFFAGSGTTLAVAHKMGRRWIAVEQMDYIKNLPEARLRKVVEGEQGGISKNVDWKGGGDFIYCEIMEWNEIYMQDIRAAKNTAALMKIYKKMKDEPFIRYEVDMSAYEDTDFKKLDFAEQQKALIACIEMNHLYVNASEMDDGRFKVADADKKLTRQFYDGKG